MSEKSESAEIESRALGHYLGKFLPGSPETIFVKSHVAGASNLTYFVSFGGSEMVLRRPPLGDLLPTAHDVEREYRFIDALYGRARVPKPIHMCTDKTIIGAPFYLMHRVMGEIMRDAIPSSCDSLEGRSAFGEEMIDALVELHSVEWQSTSLIGKSDGYLKRQLRRWTGQWALTRSTSRSLDGLDKAAAWLSDNLPPDNVATVVHGDYKPDNVIFSAEDPKLIAVLDWEMATIGDPLADLGWLLSYWGDPGDPFPFPDYVPEGYPSPFNTNNRLTAEKGFPDHETLISMYERKSGRTVKYLDFYIIFSVFKLSVILEGLYMQYLEQTAVNPQNARYEWEVPLLVDRLKRLISAT